MLSNAAIFVKNPVKHPKTLWQKLRHAKPKPFKAYREDYMLFQEAINHLVKPSVQP
jgi:hypothetical protein